MKRILMQAALVFSIGCSDPRAENCEQPNGLSDSSPSIMPHEITAPDCPLKEEDLGTMSVTFDGMRPVLDDSSYTCTQLSAEACLEFADQASHCTSANGPPIDLEPVYDADRRIQAFFFDVVGGGPCDGISIEIAED